MRLALFALCAVLAGPGTASADYFLFHMTGHVTQFSSELAAHTAVGNPFEITMGWRAEEGSGGSFVPRVYGLSGSILHPNDLYMPSSTGVNYTSSRGGVSDQPGFQPSIFLEIDGGAAGDPLLIDGHSAITDYLGLYFLPTVPVSSAANIFPTDLGAGAIGGIDIAYRATIDGFSGNWVGGVQGSIDEITRSHVVPEPASLLLIGIGGALLVARRRQRPRNR